MPAKAKPLAGAGVMLAQSAGRPCFSGSVMTQSLEDYLKTVGLLAEMGKVRITDIAVRLAVSKPSVSIAIKLLKKQGFLEHERYGTVTLTERGKEKAVEIRGRYDFLVLFLQDVVGVNVETAKRDSCKMEHIVSEETLKQMRNLKWCQRQFSA
jgi:DtxR family Mn-dependent transcriptional regulator